MSRISLIHCSLCQKHFTSRRKRSDESRQHGFRQTSSLTQRFSPSPSPSPSTVIEDDRRGLSSSVEPSSYQDSRKQSEADPGPLGLNVVFTPKNSQKVDIVFVHGLGGTSRKTWSKNGDPELFWPLKFLPLEPYICRSRILTFGYNANFRAAGSVSTSILDFAKDLLFDLKFSKDNQKEDLNVGKVSRKSHVTILTCLYLIQQKGSLNFCGSQHGRTYHQRGQDA